MQTDPTQAIREVAAALPGVARGTSCNQSSFRTTRGTFLFIGPGARGQGFKAMFKLDASLAAARLLAASDPERFEVGKTGWVTARFTAQKPLARSIWGKWLAESYGLFAGEAQKPKPRAAKKRSVRRP